MSGTGPLDREIARFNEALDTLLKDEGKFALLCGDGNIDVFESHEDALKAGYEKYGLTPFLVKRITRFPEVLQFTRFALGSCQASQSR